MFKAEWDRQIKVYVYFWKYIVRDIVSKTVESKNMWKIQNQRHVANVSDNNL